MGPHCSLKAPAYLCKQALTDGRETNLWKQFLQKRIKNLQIEITNIFFKFSDVSQKKFFWLECRSTQKIEKHWLRSRKNKNRILYRENLSTIFKSLL
jgi:hypothetical protein